MTRQGESAWVFGAKGGKIAWIPYLKELCESKDKHWKAIFQGGELQLVLREFKTLMFYGRSGALPVEFLAQAAQAGVAIIVHHRHASSPTMLMPQVRPGAVDIATAQILARENQRRRAVIAKACVIAKMRQSRWIIQVSDADFQRVRQASDIAHVRRLEATHAKRYWDAYFAKLKLEKAHRRDGSPVSLALDALSHFLAAILLRWVLLHRFLPSHGFLHEPVSHQALLYDLIEPMRHWIEQAVAMEYEAGGDEDLTARATQRLKTMLDEMREVPQLQIEASRKAIVHGHVLALRAYIVGDMRNLIFPLDSDERELGRPVKVSYEVPGQKKRYR